jgi:hypothetical protein
MSRKRKYLGEFHPFKDLRGSLFSEVDLNPLFVYRGTIHDAADSMEQSPSVEADSHSARQEIPCRRILTDGDSFQEN